jgi:hypothetical protein
MDFVERIVLGVDARQAEHRQNAQKTQAFQNPPLLLARAWKLGLNAGCPHAEIPEIEGDISTLAAILASPSCHRIVSVQPRIPPVETQTLRAC